MKQSIELSGENKEKIVIAIVPSSVTDSIKVITEAEAIEQGEAIHQISEGASYEYLIDGPFIFEEIPGIVSVSKLNRQAGRITPNIYVGTLPINILDDRTLESVGILRLEVRSVKASYREDYRRMLEDIAEKCSELLMQYSSPVSQTFEIDPEKDAATSYQRFAFIKSVINSIGFDGAVHRIISSPNTRWKNIAVETSIQGVKKVDRNVSRQICSSNNRVLLPKDHSLAHHGSLPAKISIRTKIETLDTPENRFIKFALESFQALCSDFSRLKGISRAKNEASVLEEKLHNYLSHSFFSEVENLSSLPLNNPVLQRKEGYRDVYRAWILFDLAAKLVWKGGQDVYSGNKRDVAVLYEYWLFFKLIEVVTEVFNIPYPEPHDLLEATGDGVGLKLRQGGYLPIQGVSDIGSRKLKVKLSYNRTYKGNKSYPEPGSWSRDLRPDYTLSIWPDTILEEQAEHEELIAHMHFDSKYKIEQIRDVFVDRVQLDEEKDEQRKGTYQNIDLLKMHAYKDAIRRTVGAYILYPGDDIPARKIGFHEIIPGLGAFAIRPSEFDNGVAELKAFLTEVTKHLMNRTSHREKMNFRTYEIYKDGISNEVTGLFPEATGQNRHFNPDETYVLVAFYKSNEQLKWIENKRLYNARIGLQNGSLRLNPLETVAKYLLLHGAGSTKSSKLFKLSGKGPRLVTKDDLINNGYPSPSQLFYLVYDIVNEVEPEFRGMAWDVAKLENYRSFRQSAFPIIASLSKLMSALV